MSVGEFVLVASASVPVIFASHECIRLYSFHRAAEVLLLQHLAKAALSSLAHIEKDTFRPSVGQENSIERDLKTHFNRLSQVPVLEWQWSSQAEVSSFRSLLSVRVSVLGPSRIEPLQPVQAQVTLCVRSWLEPLLRITRDGRSCVGEYLPESERSHATGRGIALKLSATRVVPMNVHVFHYGVYRHEQLPRSEK